VSPAGLGGGIPVPIHGGGGAGLSDLARGMPDSRLIATVLVPRIRKRIGERQQGPKPQKPEARRTAEFGHSALHTNSRIGGHHPRLLCGVRCGNTRAMLRLDALLSYASGSQFADVGGSPSRLCLVGPRLCAVVAACSVGNRPCKCRNELGHAVTLPVTARLR
jgi:hypothetical protein